MNLISSHVNNLKLSPAEQKAVATAQKRVLQLEELASPYLSQGRAAMKDARWRACQEATPESIAALAESIGRCNVAEDVAREVKLAVATNINRAVDTLKPVALRCIDDLKAGVMADAAEHQKLLAQSPLGAAVDAGAAQRAVADALAWLETQRGRVENEHAALELLVEFGQA